MPLPVPTIDKATADRIRGDYAGTEVKYLVLSYVYGEGTQVAVTGHLARCKTLNGALRRLVVERADSFARDPHAAVGFRIYDVAAEAFREE